MDLALFNRHWKEGFVYPFSIHRELYVLLEQSLQRKLITSVVGLRRTGKTTLLKQLINKLIEQGVRREQILFYSFDSEGELEEVFNNFLRVLGKDLGEQKLFVFLDEVQKLKHWQNKIKVYYDHYPNIKFVVSGSSSVGIRQKSESLAGRIQEFWLAPLSFREFLIFRGKKELIEKQGMFAGELERELEVYAGRQFIEILSEKQEFVESYVDTLARKIIFEDIPQVFPIEQPQVLWRVFTIITHAPGMLLDFHSLASDLGINEKTLANYVDYLEMAFLIKRVYNFSYNQLTSERKLKKVYPLASSFCRAGMPQVIESLVVTQLQSKFFWRKTHEVDCIVVEGKKVVPIEVKYSEKVKEQELKGLWQFMAQFGVQEGVVLTKNVDKKEGDILYVPVWKWLVN